MYSKVLSIAFSLTILISSVFILKNDQSGREIKRDFIEVSRAKYGIFNVDVWKEEISTVIANKIDEYQFDPKNRQDLVKKIESFLYDGVDVVEASYRSRQYRSITSFFQNAVASGADIFDRIRENIPSIARDIVADLEKPETRAQIKRFIQVRIDEYADQTFAQLDYTELNRITTKYGIDDRNEIKQYLSGQLIRQDGTVLLFKIAIYLSLVGLVVILLTRKRVSKSELIAALTSSIILLFLGLFLPMIDIDARISKFNLVVLGEHIGFENQILYFKSKSILEVVGLMLSQGKPDIIAVGFLVLTFSVLFPFAKLISCIGILAGKLKDQAIVEFLVFKSGKWSMADVLVVAIFMAYVGFSSILTEQLGQLEKISESLEVLTTNRSELNTGFFMFFGFVCLSLVITGKELSR